MQGGAGELAIDESNLLDEKLLAYNKLLPPISYSSNKPFEETYNPFLSHVTGFNEIIELFKKISTTYETKEDISNRFMTIIAFILDKITEVLKSDYFSTVNEYTTPKLSDDEIKNIKNKANEYFNLIDTNREKIDAYFTKLQNNNDELPNTMDKRDRNIIYNDIKKSLEKSDSSEIVKNLKMPYI